MQFENPFKKKSRPQEFARAVSSGELESQDIALQAADKVNLGKEALDGDLSILSDDELLQIAAGHVSKEEMEAYYEDEGDQKLAQLEEKIKDEYEALVATKDSLSPEAQQKMNEIQEFIKRRKEEGRNPSFARILAVVTSIDTHHMDDIEATLSLFSPEIRDARRQAILDQKTDRELTNIRSVRGNKLQAELERRGLVL